MGPLPLPPGLPMCTLKALALLERGQTPHECGAGRAAPGEQWPCWVGGWASGRLGPAAHHRHTCPPGVLLAPPGSLGRGHLHSLRRACREEGVLCGHSSHWLSQQPCPGPSVACGDVQCQGAPNALQPLCGPQPRTHGCPWAKVPHIPANMWPWGCVRVSCPWGAVPVPDRVGALAPQTR